MFWPKSIVGGPAIGPATGEASVISPSSKLALIFYASAVLTAGPLRGQTLTGTILGTISDQSHAVIQGAQVKITEINTNYRRTEVTNDSGFFAFANLDPGNFRVEVAHPGFRTVVRSNVALAPNSTIRVDVELTPGAVTETIDVTGEAPVLQTDRTD